VVNGKAAISPQMAIRLDSTSKNSTQTE